MARLKNLVLEEFSIVRGDGVKPANPGAVALAYKAQTNNKEMDMAQTQAPAQDTKKSLAGQIADFAMQKLGKATTVRTYESNYASTSTSTEKVTEDQAQPEGNATVIVVTDSTEKATDAAAATKTSADAAAVHKTAAAAATQTDAPDAGSIDIAKAVTDGMEPVLTAITKLGDRVTAIEKTSVGSQTLNSTGGQVTENGGAKFAQMTKYLQQLTPGQRLTKATITSSGWTYGLAIDEAKQFLQYVIDESTLLKKIRTVQMTAPIQNIEKIGLGSKVLKKGVPGTDPGDTVSLSGPTQIQLVSKEIIAIVSIGDETLEDNIEGEAFLQKLLGMIGRAAGNEIEQAAIHGDTAVADTYILDRWDGFYKRAIAGGHVIEAMTDTDRYWPGTAGAKATKLLKALPTKYRNDPRTLGWVQHPDVYLDYNDELATKGFSEAFQSISGMRDLPLRGVTNIQVPLMKTDMSFTHSATPYTDGTFVMLTDLRNLIVGIQRDVRIEAERDARRRCTDFVLTMRADVQIENADAIAIYNHAKVKA